MGASNLMRPGLIVRPWVWTWRWCFVRTFTPCTTSRSKSGRTLMTSPRLPFSSSFPLIISTVSPFRILTFILRSSSSLKHFRGQADDLHEAPLAQLAGHRAKDAAALRVLAVDVQQDHGIVIEADVGTVLPAPFLGTAHDHGLDDIRLLDRALRCGRLDRAHHDITDRPVAAAGASHDVDHQEDAGAGVVRHLDACFLLDHGCASTTVSSPGSAAARCPCLRIVSTTQRFSFESGRLSTIWTWSPIWQPSSSWAMTRRLECTTLR